MRIIVAGRGALAVRGAHLFALLAQTDHRDISVECVPSPGDDDPRRSSPSLRAAAIQSGWLSHDDTRDLGLSPSDIFVSLQYARVIPMADLGRARALNLHFSPLPRHRGSLSCYWPIESRDAEAGVTLHEIAAQVDSGPIVATRSFALPTFLTAEELFVLFEQHAFELLCERAMEIIDGNYRSVPQHERAVAAHRRADVDFTALEITDFARPAAEVRDACLSLAFPAFQHPTFLGRRIGRAYALDLEIRTVGIGDVVADTGDTVMIRCSTGVVCLELSR
jgi:methionyl-tRNA formyltransferase